MRNTNRIRVIPRMEYGSGTWTPILFLPDDRRGALIGCYSHVGQHSEAHLDYYRDTRSPKAGECDALVAEYNCIPPSVPVVVLKRLPAA